MEKKNYSLEGDHIRMKELSQSTNLPNISTLTDTEIAKFKDSRGYNLLMLASEAGQIDAVNNLIARGEEVNNEVDGESAASLSFTQGHHQIVLTLLKANSKIPHNFQHGTASDDLRAFVVLSTTMHSKINSVDETDPISLKDAKSFLRQNIEKNSNLRYFYDRANNSLLKRAIFLKFFVIYEFLLALNIFLAPHEAMDDIVEKLTEENRKKFSEINFRLSPNFLTEPMMILLRNCKFGPYSPQNFQNQFIEIVRGVFDYLFKIPKFAIVLKIVAAYRDFKIIFDFKRDSVTFLDPRADPETDGLFYLSGRIYVAAKDMLNPSTALNTIGVIAHELCHCAMSLVYENDAKPYYKNKSASFRKISLDCEQSKDDDYVVGSVFECYDEAMHHAELIVRVPQMLAIHANTPEILEEKCENFKSLFDFYENSCVPEMEAKLTKIESKFNPYKKAQRKLKLQKRLILILIFSIIIGVILSILALIFFYNPTISWSDLSFVDKFKFNNSTIKFHGVDVKFRELFAEDSEVYDFLSSEQIKNTLKGETEDLSKTIKTTLDSYIFLTWSNMTEELRNYFSSCKVSFQGKFVNLGEISTTNALALLTPREIGEILNKKSFNISSKVDTKSLYIERYFVDEKIKVLSELFYNQMSESEKNLTKSYYQDGKINIFDPDVKGFEKVLSEVQEQKSFLLSSSAGDGKSTVFRHFSLKIKEKFPAKWVQYVDLKKHLEAYKFADNLNFSSVEKIEKFIGENLLNLCNFEQEIFKGLFASGNVIFFWDGVDEIAPNFLSFMLDLTLNLKLFTQNRQFISTRPQHSGAFQESLKINAYKLFPFSKLDRFEFMVKLTAGRTLMTDKNFTAEEFFQEFKTFYNKKILNREKIIEKFKVDSESLQKLIEAVTKGEEIFRVIERSDEVWYGADRTVSNPLLVLMISEISLDKNFKVENSNFNSYDLYETFIDKKFGIFREKGEIVGIDGDKVTQNRLANIFQVHQAFAIKTLYSVHLYNLRELSILKTLNKLSNEQISRYGILQPNFQRTIDLYSDANYEDNFNDDFDFSHRTFAEFFLSQFLIDSVDKTEPKSGDGKIVIGILYKILVNRNIPLVRCFLVDFAENMKNFSPFFRFWHDQKIKNIKFIGSRKDFGWLEDIQFIYYFQTHKNISYGDRFLLHTPVSISRICKFKDQIIEILGKADVFQEIYGDDLTRYLFKFKSLYDGKSFLYCVSGDFPSDSFRTFLALLKKFLTRGEINELIMDQRNELGESSMMRVEQHKNKEDLEFFFNFFREI